ncbi:MAG: phytoene/squalene synthase family protein [Pseudomonadota bacterium]|nr:phytoene/squalene synthase family protein [Pseudomonadota bacterium]
MRGRETPPNGNYAYCEGLLRRDDRDRWLASLFVPPELRRHTHALYAFSLEIARVREIVSEPLLGEIRFQWWRDALEGTHAGETKANPVAAALLDTIARFDLPEAPLLESISARGRDLYGEPMDSVVALESYTKATCSNLLRLAAFILDGEEAAASRDAALHAGIAYGITGLIRALPWHSVRGQVFIPVEILLAHGPSRDDLAAGHASEAVLAALADLRAVARAHLDAFDARLHSLPEKSRPAFLPVCLCEPYLRLMEKPSYEPFKTVIELPQWRRQWILWRAARRWG